MRVQFTEIVGFVWLVGGIAGCTDSPVPQGPVPPGQTTPTPAPSDGSARGYLSEPRTFAITPSSSAQVTAHRTYLSEMEETATLPLLGGDVTVQARSDGMLAITAMTLDLGNISLSATTVPPDGLNLMGVTLSLKARADAVADWTADGTAASATGRTDLLLDWSLEAAAGAVEPLATQRIADVPLDISVVGGANGRLTLTVHATRDGVFWQWSGLLELSDLKLDLDAIQ
jgi:hypothetical protein